VPLEVFSEVVNEVLNFGFNDGPGVNKKRIEQWVNEGQKQIARSIEAPEFQSTEVLTLTKGKYKYPQPAEFIVMQDIFYPEMQERLRPVDLQQFDRNPPAVVEGPPSIYTLYASEVWFFPTPYNSTDKLELRFIKNPPALVNESDVPVLHKDYLHLLVGYATARAFGAEDDSEMATYHEGIYKKDLAAYAADALAPIDDRPKVLDGTWGGSY
jgi:hypothetical protein